VLFCDRQPRPSRTFATASAHFPTVANVGGGRLLWSLLVDAACLGLSGTSGAGLDGPSDASDELQVHLACWAKALCELGSGEGDDDE